MPRRGLWAGLFAACVLAAGARALQLGKDGNWDLKNYHWYNAWALLNDRRGWDIAPAQIQTFHNPLGDLPFLGLAHAFTDPRHVAFCMAVTAAIAAFFLLRTLALTFPAGRVRGAWAWIAAAVAVGVTGAAGTATLGTTMNEWPSAALAMAAIFLCVRAVVEGDAARPRAMAVAGFLAGCAVGLKLTYAIFALGILVALAFHGTSRESARRIAIATLAMGAGFLATYGWWGWILWREYGNPFFPYFNGIFESPWWHPRNWFDRNFGPRDWRQWLFFPLYFSHRSTLVSEVGFRDYRLATLLVLALLCLLRYRVGALLGRVRPPQLDRRAPVAEPAAVAFLAVFTLVSYLAWIKLYGIYRYLVPLELVSGALIVACILYLVRRRPLRFAAVILLACLLVGTTRPGSWGRIPFGEGYFEVVAPELPPRSLVIVGYMHPTAYVIPFLRQDARFISPFNNFIAPGEKHELARRAEEAIRAHDGPIFLMQHRVRERGDETVLRYFALAAGEDEACLPVAAPMSANLIRLCPLRRVPPPRAFGLARGEQGVGELREAAGAG